MEHLNELFFRIFEKAIVLVVQLGVPLAILAWFSVFIPSIALVFVLKRHSLHGKLRAPLIIGIISLIAHLSDYLFTLKMSPNLSLEANPLACIVLERMGVTFTKWYGLTGKIMLAVLSFECYALYLIKRETLFPEKAADFISFWKNFGRKGSKAKSVRLANMMNLFLFLFALSGPFCIYIAFLSSIIDKPLYEKMPSVLVMIIPYLFIITAFYFIDNYRVFKMKCK